LDVTIKK